MLPINTQPQKLKINFETLPSESYFPPVAPFNREDYFKVIEVLRGYSKIVIKAGGGTRDHYKAVRIFSHLIGAPVVLSPGSTGVLSDQDVMAMVTKSIYFNLSFIYSVCDDSWIKCKYAFRK